MDQGSFVFETRYDEETGAPYQYARNTEDNTLYWIKISVHPTIEGAFIFKLIPQA